MRLIPHEIINFKNICVPIVCGDRKFCEFKLHGLNQTCDNNFLANLKGYMVPACRICLCSSMKDKDHLIFGISELTIHI